MPHNFHTHKPRSPSPKPEASEENSAAAAAAAAAPEAGGKGGSEGSDQLSPAPSSAGGQVPPGGKSMRRLSQTSRKSARVTAGSSDATHDAMGNKWSKGLWDNMESKLHYTHACSCN